ncbi:MAG: hypothetical protein WBX01_09740 [Nitrososphaeraceae archaeon]|jgi:hypothetical protein
MTGVNLLREQRCLIHELFSYLAGDITHDEDHYLDFGWRTTFSKLCNRVLKIRRTISASKTGSKIVIQSTSESEKIDDLVSLDGDVI